MPVSSREKVFCSKNVLREAERDGKAFPQKSFVLENLQAELAGVLDAQGKSFEAEIIAREVLASKRSLSSFLDRDTCAAMDNLAHILSHVHKEKEAEELCWQVIKQHGNDGRPNEEGLSQQAGTALITLLRLLRIDLTLEPVLWCDKILECQDIELIGGIKVFQNHVRVLSILLAKSGFYTEGLEFKARWRDKNDPIPLWLVNSLAEVYLKDSEYDKAKAILEPLVSDAHRSFGPKDGLTLSSMGFLALATGSHTEEGERLLRSVIDDAEPNSKWALTAWYGLGNGYHKRLICLKAFEAFSKAAELAEEHFDESEPLAAQAQNTWRQFQDDHIFSYQEVRSRHSL